MKNIIIGIDGGTFEHILLFIKKNLLPNFKKLIAEGFSSFLKVTIPPVTIPSFPCIFSGLSVEELGYCTFVNPINGLFSSKLWRDQSILSINDLKIFSLNLPSTYPVWKINGEIISGLLTPYVNNKMCYPKDLIGLIKEDWIIDGKDIMEVFKAFNTKKKIFIEKAEKDFNLLIYIIRVPDCITHHPKVKLSSTFEAIKKGYIMIDEFLGNILESVEFDNLFIISDHGLKVYQHEFNIKRFLEKNNLIFYNNDFISKILSVLIKILGFFNIKLFNTTYFHNKIKKILNKFKIFNKKNIPSSFLSTKFYHFYSNYGGIVFGKHDEKRKKRIKEMLLQSKYVKNIITHQKETLPDFIIELNDKYLFSVKSSFFIRNRFNSFNHSDKGIMIAYGKNIQKKKFPQIDYIDFAPTILKLFNINKLNHMHGQVLKIFKNRY